MTPSPLSTGYVRRIWVPATSPSSSPKIFQKMSQKDPPSCSSSPTTGAADRPVVLASVGMGAGASGAAAFAVLCGAPPAGRGAGWPLVPCQTTLPGVGGVSARRRLAPSSCAVSSAPLRSAVPTWPFCCGRRTVAAPSAGGRAATAAGPAEVPPPPRVASSLLRASPRRCAH
eukprot:CAMPEP_0194304810 /NCGR_PEP_ID=MMETSP0171-20130528/2428_1 /TAXON_ID=218684 /ORGANISM="Corethron pennatum, Strain L29A3" /LENGTH=171 /DNA_ID=CAMNT_0039056169 /DNA_START=6 /DNA_END=518 /DNA_ORIENTATION=+